MLFHTLFDLTNLNCTTGRKKYSHIHLTLFRQFFSQPLNDFCSRFSGFGRRIAARFQFYSFTGVQRRTTHETGWENRLHWITIYGTLYTERKHHTTPPSFVGRLNSIWTKQRRRLQRDRVHCHCHQPPPPSRDRVESPGDDVHATVSQIKVQNLQHRSSVVPLLQSRGESAANRRRFCCCHYSRVLCLLRAEEILFSWGVDSETVTAWTAWAKFVCVVIPSCWVRVSSLVNVVGWKRQFPDTMRGK